jgi:hypothetical protein
MFETQAVGIQPRTIGIASVIASLLLLAVVFFNVTF